MTRMLQSYSNYKPETNKNINEDLDQIVDDFDSLK